MSLETPCARSRRTVGLSSGSRGGLGRCRLPRRWSDVETGETQSIGEAGALRDQMWRRRVRANPRSASRRRGRVWQRDGEVAQGEERAARGERRSGGGGEREREARGGQQSGDGEREGETKAPARGAGVRDAAAAKHGSGRWGPEEEVARRGGGRGGATVGHEVVGWELRVGIARDDDQRAKMQRWQTHGRQTQGSGKQNLVLFR